MSKFSQSMSIVVSSDENGNNSSMGYKNTNNNGYINEQFFKKHNENQVLGKSNQFQDWKTQFSNSNSKTDKEFPYNHFNFNNMLTPRSTIPNMIKQEAHREKFDDLDMSELLLDNIQIENPIDSFFQPLIKNDPFRDPFFNN